ncbi:hypothetical protein [Streptomyces zaomyceticus]|uniref:hypothetical protein n=1 Tax=Streptomyces zaomyceticus TaxID=68286 RepID=UPI0036A4DF08
MAWPAGGGGGGAARRPPPPPRGAPPPPRVYAELVGGPLDGLLLDVTDWTPGQRASGTALETELGRYGADGRSLYDPRPGDTLHFDWSGDAP